MNTVKKILAFHFDISPAIAVSLILLAALATTLLMFLMQPDGVGDILSYFRNSNGLILFLNFWPPLVAMSLLFLLTNSLAVSIPPVLLAGLAVSFINRYKIELRQSPFLPYDFYLVREVLGVSKSLNISGIVMGSLAAVFIILLMILTLRIFRVRKTSLKRRLALSSILLLTFFIVNNTVYKKLELYESFYTNGSVYNQVELFNSRGFLYSFIYEYNHMNLRVPKDYDASVMEAYIAEHPAALPAASGGGIEKMNIIIIMGESFSDIGDNPAVDYSSFTDPLRNYKKLREESISGHIITPNMGGGTSDTEFDVLTGLSSRYLRGVPYTYTLVNKPTESLASFFKELGYKTSAIHPGNFWFYNRANAYEYLGFDKTTFIEDFGEYSYKAEYPEESIAIDKIIEEIENKGDEPLFNFTVTIQNHGPYNQKYEAERNFNTSLPINPEGIDALSNYFVGLADADRELNRLCSYLDGREEPYVLLYFGDHLPSLPRDVYSYLPGVYIDTRDLTQHFHLYEAPFMLWQNPAAKRIGAIDRNFAANNFENNRTISSQYLPAVFLKLMGYGGSWPFMDYVYSLMEEHPIVMENFFIDRAGKVHEDLLPQSDPLYFYRQWVYYGATH